MPGDDFCMDMGGMYACIGGGMTDKGCVLALSSEKYQ